MKSTNDIGWIRVHSTPLIRELQKTINEWIERYTHFLLQNTLKEIKNIEDFTNEVASGIKVIPESSESQREKDLLMKVMRHLRDVKMVKDRASKEFEPLKETVVLLKKHGVKMDDGLLVQIENAKTALNEVSTNALGPVKETILPL
jgi:dynein heavy chain